VATFIHATTFPERQERPPLPSILDPYKPYLHQRLDAGCRNGMDVLREIQAQGYTGSQASVLGYLAQYRREQGLPPRKQTSAQPATARRVRIRHVVGLILWRVDTLDAAERHERSRLWDASPTVTRASELAHTFAHLVRQRAGARLDTWLDDVSQSASEPLMRFAVGIRETYAEVRAALELPWSSGQVEGQINRLKTIKRQMYGRAKFALLRARVLAPGCSRPDVRHTKCGRAERDTKMIDKNTGGRPRICRLRCRPGEGTPLTDYILTIVSNRSVRLF
jgi:transposase